MDRYITGTGNLAGVPELQHNDQDRAYADARVIVADRYQDANEQWADGPATGYDVLVRWEVANGLTSMVRLRVQRRAGSGPVDVREVERIVREIRDERDGRAVVGAGPAGHERGR